METIAKQALNSVTVHHAEVNTPNEIRAVLREFLADEDQITNLVKKFAPDLKMRRSVMLPLDNSPENMVSLVFSRGGAK